MTGMEGVLASQVPLITSSVITAIGGWLIGRRKHKAEASLLEIKAVTAITEFYETALNDTKKQLDYYIKLTEANREEIISNRKELNEMKVFIDQILTKSCSVEGCVKRKIIVGNFKLNQHTHEIDNTENNNKKIQE